MRAKLTSADLLKQGFSETFLDRFWSKVRKNGPVPKHMPHLGPCWQWTAHCNRGGYGTFRVGANNAPHILAHRASWIVHFGHIPKGSFVLHHCDAPCCCNPKHLFLGHHLDNARDKNSKGRGVYLKGEDHGMAKLTWNQVKAIRFLYDPQKRNGPELARQFGIGKSTISGILLHKNWK